MKLIPPIAVSAMQLVIAPAAFAEDVTRGTILALDREARLLLLEDRTVSSPVSILPAMTAGLEAGNRIEIACRSDEEGVSALNSITPKLN